MGCFSGHLTSSASDQKLFCAVCSEFEGSFDEFVGEKVVSPFYSSTILAPPPSSYFFKKEYLIEILGGESLRNGRKKDTEEKMCEN